MIDITDKQYQSSGKWLTEHFFGMKLKFLKSFTDMYPSYMNVFNKCAKKLDEKSFVIYTTESGWVQSQNSWSYVPVSFPNKSELLYSETLRSKYKMNSINDWTLEEAFQKTWSMLDIADKRVTLPLLSYTFLSLVSSFMSYTQDTMPKFSICLSGSNKLLDRQGFANLFCNLYERKLNISSLNSKYHLKSDMDKKLLEKKFSKIRDGVFIVDAFSRPKIVERAIQGVQNFDIDNMLLILNEKKLDKEFILNLDINELDINSDQIADIRQHPDILSACIYYLTENFRQIFAHDDISNKKKIGSYLHKRQKHFYKLINRNDVPQEIDKVHMYSCLMVGLDLLLNLIKNERIVFDDEIQDAKAQAYLDEALQLFQNECAVEGTAVNITENDDTVEVLLNPVREEHIVFLDKLFDLLPRPFPHFKEKRDNPALQAWTDRNNENILWIRNDIFHQVLLSQDNDFGELNKDEQRSIITKYKTVIYEKLHSEGISVVILIDSESEKKTIIVAANA